MFEMSLLLSCSLLAEKQQKNEWKVNQFIFIF